MAAAENGGAGNPRFYAAKPPQRDVLLPTTAGGEQKQQLGVLGHRNFFSGPKSCGERNGGWRARFGAGFGRLSVGWSHVICAQMAFWWHAEVWQVLHVLTYVWA
jgi:hypothetical protein